MSYELDGLTLVLDYDPEAHANRAVYKHMHERAERDDQTSITPEQVRSDPHDRTECDQALTCDRRTPL